MDAATRNGIDDIRELIDLSQYQAPSGHRTIILDEAHALSGPAWQALLKTLEEPSTTTTWLLVTTEPERIPATVASRCIPLQFMPISSEHVQARLRVIANAEGLWADGDVLAEIAREADGVMRDAIVALYALVLSSRRSIALDRYRHLFGPPNCGPALLDTIAKADLTKAAQVLDSWTQLAPDPRRLVDDCITTLADRIPQAPDPMPLVHTISALWELRQALTHTPLGTRAALACVAEKLGET